MKRLLLLLVMVLVLKASFVYASERVYTLGEILRVASEGAERIKISAEEVNIARAADDRARSALTPRLSLFGEGRRYTESESVGTQVLQPETSVVWGARLEQGISLGGREFSNLRAARENLSRTRYEYSAAKENYLFGVATAYYAVLRAKKSLSIADSNMQRLKKHRDAAELRLRAGEATKNALLRAEAELSGAEAQKTNAQNRLLLAKAELARTAAIDGQFELAEPMPEEHALETLEALKAIALSRRPEVLASERRVQAAKAQLDFARGAYMPSVSLEGVYSSRRDDPESQNAVNESIYAGLKLSFTVFDSKLRSSEVREAKSRLRQAELLLEDTKRAVALDVEAAYLELLNQRETLRSLQYQLAYAQDNYEAVTRQFDYGLATSTDVMDANSLLVSAENQYADALYLKDLAWLRLLKATGTFIENTLGEDR